MIPIHELLHRIHRDPEFGKVAFEAFEDDGSTHLVPFHRVREVWRDGVLIWQRPPRKPV